MRRIKSKIIGLQYEYNRAAGRNRVCVTWNGETCILNIDGQIYKMNNRDALEFLKKRMKELPVRKPKSKGYIGKSMSVNARDSYERGLKPISRITVQDLKQHDFPYSLSFFKWLVHENYIAHSEFHHTSAVYNRTPFYSMKAISYAARYLNLDLLYEIYTGKMTKEEAARKRRITYVRVKTSGSLFGSRECVIMINGVMCDGIVFYSPRLCFKYDEERMVLVAQYDEMPQEFGNPYLKDLREELIMRKTSAYRRYLKT